MRESKDYRSTLEYINSIIPDGMMLTTTDVCKVTGFSRELVGKCFGAEMKKFGKAKYINKTTLARLLTQ